MSQDHVSGIRDADEDHTTSSEEAEEISQEEDRPELFLTSAVSADEQQGDLPGVKEEEEEGWEGEFEDSNDKPVIRNKHRASKALPPQFSASRSVEGAKSCSVSTHDSLKAPLQMKSVSRRQGRPAAGSARQLPWRKPRDQTRRRGHDRRGQVVGCRDSQSAPSGNVSSMFVGLRSRRQTKQQTRVSETMYMSSACLN